MTDEAVRLSVIVAAYNAKETIARCLRSLTIQDCEAPFEIIVVDSSSDRTAELVARDFPDVRLFTFDERKFPGDARNFGVSRARGDVLAFTDADCVADRDWVRRILEAHSAPDPVIGGTIDNGNPASLVGWAYYFCELSAWIPGTPAGPMIEIPTGCLSVKRWAFDRYGPFLEGTYSSDTAFNWRIGLDGHRPYFAPSVRVSHINPTNFGEYLARKVFHGQSFATMRIDERRFSWPRRLFHAALSPALPFVLSLRNMRNVLIRGSYRRQFVRVFPFVFLGQAAWSWGEFLGYLGRRPGTVERHG